MAHGGAERWTITFDRSSLDPKEAQMLEAAIEGNVRLMRVAIGLHGERWAEDAERRVLASVCQLMQADFPDVRFDLVPADTSGA